MTNPYESPQPGGLQTKSGRVLLGISAIIAGIGVILGAFGAHGLEGWIHDTFDDAPKRMANWETGVRYMMYHAFGLIVTALIWEDRSRKLCQLTAAAMLSGIVLFSGCLFGWVLLDSKALVMIVPIGGLMFIVGWFLLAGLALCAGTRVPPENVSS